MLALENEIEAIKPSSPGIRPAFATLQKRMLGTSVAPTQVHGVTGRLLRAYSSRSRASKRLDKRDTSGNTARRAAGDIEGRIHCRLEEPVLTKRRSFRQEYRA